MKIFPMDWHTSRITMTMKWFRRAKDHIWKVKEEKWRLKWVRLVSTDKQRSLWKWKKIDRRLPSRYPCKHERRREDHLKWMRKEMRIRSGKTMGRNIGKVHRAMTRISCLKNDEKIWGTLSELSVKLMEIKGSRTTIWETTQHTLRRHTKGDGI